MAELKNLKKGDIVILRAFTGMAIGKKTITAADAKTVTIETTDGEQKKFSKKTGLQIEPAPKAPRFANYIVEDDGSYEKEQQERAAKKAAKAEKTDKKSKKPAPKAEPEDEDDKPAPKPKKAAAKSKKKPEPELEPEDGEDEDDDDDYEEVE